MLIVSPKIHKSLIIGSDFPQPITRFGDDFAERDLIDEQTYYGASPEFVRLSEPLLSPIANNFLAYVDDRAGSHAEIERGIFDSKVVQLMPGMYPAIPGWHCDEIKRVEGKVDCDTFHDNAKKMHYIGIIDFTGSRTEFVQADIEVPYTDSLWKEVHNAVEFTKKCAQPDRPSPFPAPPIIRLPSNHIYLMNYSCVHTATPATTAGWRWFGRLTLNTDRQIVNQIRTQTNVYLNVSEAGW